MRIPNVEGTACFHAVQSCKVGNYQLNFSIRIKPRRVQKTTAVVNSEPGRGTNSGVHVSKTPISGLNLTMDVSTVMLYFWPGAASSWFTILQTQFGHRIYLVRSTVRGLCSVTDRGGCDKCSRFFFDLYPKRLRSP